MKDLKFSDDDEDSEEDDCRRRAVEVDFDF
jgi:hypothetical protein